MIAYKILTHDFRPPIQGGHPILPASVTFPYRLPTVEVDTSDAECGAGWNACADIETAIRIAGEWPNGRPSQVFRLRSVQGACPLKRGDKIRAATWDVMGPVAPSALRDARVCLYAPMAKDGLPVEDIVTEVEAWSHALGRPAHDEGAVEAGLRGTLQVRGLRWSLRRFGDARAAWDAWAAWDARAAWAAWDARDARDAWAARAARAALDARDAWAASDAWAALDARDAWDARAARAALTVLVAARRGWTQQRPDLLTIGLRDAYAHGLAIAIPTGPAELGWAMV